MLNKLKGTIDGIKEGAAEIADKTREANAEKRAEQQIADAAEQEAAKDTVKARLRGSPWGKAMVTATKLSSAVNAVSETAKNVSGTLVTAPPPATKTEEHPIERKVLKPITDKVPDWM